MTSPVRIPADVDMADRVLGPLTARQLAILATTGLVLYAAWTATRAVVPVPVFLALAVPVGAAAAILALGHRDGVSMDRLLIAAIRQRVAPRHRVAAPEGVRPAPDWLTTAASTAASGTGTAPRRRGRRGTSAAPGREQISPSALRLPARAVTDTGVVDLGPDGLAVVAVASTVNFALRTAQEQEGLVASFGRYLHSLTAPVQVLVRAQRLDLTGQISELRARAGGLPHPALEAAALEHADYLAQLSEQTDLLCRQVLLVLREPLDSAVAAGDGLGGPGPVAVLSSLARGRHRRAEAATSAASAAARRAAESRLVRRLGEAIELLGPAGIVVTPLDAGQATAVLASACNPDSLLPPTSDMAGADEVITSPGGQQSDPYSDGSSGGIEGVPDDSDEDDTWDGQADDDRDYEDDSDEDDDVGDDLGRRRF
ncbi:PrgI family protein [Actinokineospora alba]|uniref:PrgI family protein n=2 Tax=Actinokineospora alba TaxID=504798 RepID=A0A1H0LFP6_9PSEU|nr:PrgI family protein [Actinokineospora alba]TDP67309.1 PrgI family protein [Actinokineospora alba]SDJ00927.1 PrgI family protein [Actinokineospora alba]SDO66915.1 PrgI family protein [Actinokineospora alba]